MNVIAALWIKSRLPFGSRERLRDSSEPSTGLRRGVVAQHWAYGRWAVGVGVLSGLMLNVYYIVMPTTHGLESTAILKALMNLMMPAWQTSMALSTATVPWLVRVRGTREFGTVLRRLLCLCFVGGLCYWLALGLAHEQVIRLLYGGRYAQESRLLWLVGLVPIGTGTIGVLETALRSLERTRQVFQAYVLSSVSTCVIGLPLMFIWGPGGAVVGFLLSLAFGIGSMAWSLQGAQARPQEQVA